MNERYEYAKKKYAEFGVDADAAIEKLAKFSISIHCWQGDDVIGFDGSKSLSGGIQATGDYIMRLRINHECVGDWFTHKRRFSYEEVGAFFAKFAAIIKEEVPNISTVFCARFIDPKTGKIEREEEFAPAYKAADVWSADCYLALHFRCTSSATGADWNWRWKTRTTMQSGLNSRC